MGGGGENGSTCLNEDSRASASKTEPPVQRRDADPKSLRCVSAVVCLC